MTKKCFQVGDGQLSVTRIDGYILHAIVTCKVILEEQKEMTLHVWNSLLCGIAKVNMLYDASLPLLVKCYDNKMVKLLRSLIVFPSVNSW